MRPIEFLFSINGTALERAYEIKDLGVIMDGRMYCFCLISRQLSPNHRESWDLISICKESFMTRILIRLCVNFISKTESQTCHLRLYASPVGSF
jgi:hypothetical protein